MQMYEMPILSLGPKILEGGNGKPLQYSCLENPMSRGALQATVNGITKSWIQLSTQKEHKVLLRLRILKTYKAIIKNIFPNSDCSWHSSTKGNHSYFLVYHSRVFHAYLNKYKFMNFWFPTVKKILFPMHTVLLYAF